MVGGRGGGRDGGRDDGEGEAGRGHFFWGRRDVFFFRTSSVLLSAAASPDIPALIIGLHTILDKNTSSTTR